jgi:outer membrane protein TolC
MEVKMKAKRRSIILVMVLLLVILSSVQVFAEELAIEEEKLTLTLEEAKAYILENGSDRELQDIILRNAEVAYTEDMTEVKRAEKALSNMPTRNPITGAVIPEVSVNKELAKNGGLYKSVELTFTIAKWNHELGKNRLLYNAEKAYYDLLKAESDYDIAYESYILAEKQYETGKLKYEKGQISKQQLLNLDLSLSEARSRYTTALMSFEMQMLSFKRTLGIPFETEVELVDEIIFREYKHIDLDEAIKTALDNNVSVQMAKEGHELAELTFRAVRKRYSDISLRYREQEIATARALFDFESAQSNSELNVRNLLLNLRNSEQLIITNRKQVEQAHESLRLAELSFELGQNTAIEINQSNINLMNAKKNLAQSLYSFNLAFLDFEYAMGIGK